MMPGGLDPISELQRLTVSLRGGFEQKDGCLVFHFTGQLDAYSEKQFMEYVATYSMNCFSEYASS